MNKRKSILAISVIAMAAIVSVAVVSCKKEDTRAMSTNNKKEAFDPRQIEDMSTYLKDFKNKMLSAAKGDDEALSLEEAAWHLSSVANYDFANANVECDDVRFDTLYSTVSITNGSVLLSDLSAAYGNISTSIDKFYHTLMLDHKYFRFINITISEDGNVAVFLMTTFMHSAKDLGDHLWYFGDDSFNYLYVYCPEWFPNDSSYLWNGSGKVKLEQRLNLIESHSLWNGGGVIPPVEYYTSTRTHVFDWNFYIDEYGSPSAYESRLYIGSPYYEIPSEEMCYYTDSYAGLGYQFIVDNYYTKNECPVAWSISCTTSYNIAPWPLGYHTLTVSYGKRHSHEEEPGSQD